jgi:glycine cleavage system protein P-like pyridoxal-binding family
MSAREKVIFEYSHPGRGASDQWPHELPASALADLPAQLRRAQPPLLPEVGELETVRHFTRLSQLNFSIDQGLQSVRHAAGVAGAPSARPGVTRPGISRVHV